MCDGDTPAADRASQRLGQRQYAGRGGIEPAGLDVERAEVLVEVDVEPLAAGRSRLDDAGLDEPLPDAAAPMVRSHERVDDEGVRVAVPRHVHPSDEPTIHPSAHPSQAVRLDLASPVVLKKPMPETLGVERVNLGAGKGSAPLVLDIHSTEDTCLNPGKKSAPAVGRGARFASSKDPPSGCCW